MGATIMSFLISNSFVFFLVAFFGGFIARSAYQKGNLQRARTVAAITFMASSLLLVTYGVIAILTMGAMNLIMAGIWGYFAWRDWQFLKLFSSSGYSGLYKPWYLRLLDRIKSLFGK